MIYQVHYAVMLLASQFREYFHLYKLFIYFFTIEMYRVMVIVSVVRFPFQFGREIVHVLHEKIRPSALWIVFKNRNLCIRINAIWLYFIIWRCVSLWFYYPFLSALTLGLSRKKLFLVNFLKISCGVSLLLRTK